MNMHYSTLTRTASVGMMKENLRVSMQKIRQKANKQALAIGAPEAGALTKMIDELEGFINNTRSEITAHKAGRIFSDEVKKQQVEKSIQQLRDKAESMLKVIDFHVDLTKKKLNEKLRPAEPEMVLVTDKKADIQMMLGNKQGAEVKQGLYQLAATAAAKGDNVTLHVLQSDWSDMFLQSKGVQGIAAMDFRQGLTEAIRPYWTDEQKQANEFLELLNDPEVENSLQNLPYVVDGELDQLSS